MMLTTDVKPGRVGLNTTTGQRNAPAPRLAGSKPLPVRTQVTYEGEGSYEERLERLLKKQEEKEKYDRITEDNKNRVGAGESPAKDVGGSVGVLDASLERFRKVAAQMGGDTNALLAQKGAQDNALALQAKGLGLGQYKGQADSTVIDYGMGQDSPFKARMALQAAADNAAAAASLEAQRNNNRISAKTAADAAAAADNAYSQRYAAAQAADAQKFASTMQMFGNITQPGAYKYWGG